MHQIMLHKYQIEKEEERQEMLKGRRATIADLNKYHKEVRTKYKIKLDTVKEAKLWI